MTDLLLPELRNYNLIAYGTILTLSLKTVEKFLCSCFQEERRLFILLFSIVIIFFICTIPAAPLTIFVSDSRSRNLSFQVFSIFYFKQIDRLASLFGLTERRCIEIF